MHVKNLFSSWIFNHKLYLCFITELHFSMYCMHMCRMYMHTLYMCMSVHVCMHVLHCVVVFLPCSFTFKLTLILTLRELTLELQEIQVKGIISLNYTTLLLYFSYFFCIQYLLLNRNSHHFQKNLSC